MQRALRDARELEKNFGNDRHNSAREIFDASRTPACWARNFKIARELEIDVRQRVSAAKTPPAEIENSQPVKRPARAPSDARGIF